MDFKNYQVEKIIFETQDIITLRLAPLSGVIFDFKPGQFFMLSLDSINSKAFSVASYGGNFIDFGIKIYGALTQKLSKLRKGDVVKIAGPYGKFILPENFDNDIIFLAGGIGVGPYRSMLQYLFSRNFPQKIILIYSNKSHNDIAYKKEIENWQRQFENFKVIFCLTRETAPSQNFEAKRIDLAMIKKYCGKLDDKYFYICGRVGFVKDLKNSLLAEGAPLEFIKFESFTAT